MNIVLSDFLIRLVFLIMGENDFYVGYGTYYKEFNCNCDIQNSCILLEFGAIFQIAEIYLNGKYIQSHEGGYTAFTVDITNYIKQGKKYTFCACE